MIEAAFPLLCVALLAAVALAYASRGKPPTNPPAVVSAPVVVESAPYAPANPAFDLLDAFHNIERSEFAARLASGAQAFIRGNIADVMSGRNPEPPAPAAPKPRARRTAAADPDALPAPPARKRKS